MAVKKSSKKIPDEMSIDDMKRLFNENYLRMGEVFQKYIYMDLTAFNALVEKLKKQAVSKIGVLDVCAIKFLSRAYASGDPSSLSFVLSIITGSYGLGIREVQAKEPSLEEMYKNFTDKEKGHPKEALNWDSLAAFLFAHPEISQKKREVVELLLTQLNRREISRLQTMDIKKGQQLLDAVGQILKDYIGAKNPTLLHTIVMELDRTIAAVWELTPVKAIEAKVVKPGRKKK